MQKAVIYARFSSANQQETSITGQLRVCNEYATRNNIEVIDTYIDRAYSGRTDKRPQFQQMMEDAEKKYFSLILVYKIDRFSRDRYISAIYKKKLNDLEIKLVSCTEHIEQGSSGVIMEGLLESLSEWYSVNLSENVRRGIMENAKKLLCVGGVPPLGYKFKNKKYTIDLNEAKIVRLIFEEFSKGKGKKEISNFLTENGYRTQRGKNFTIQGITNILNNKKYAGYYIVKSIDVEVPNSIPAIVSKDLFKKCQDILNKKTIHHKTESDYILTEKLYCSCGRKMVGVSGYGRDKTLYRYYKCKGKCGKKNIPKSEIENKVIDYTLDYILSEKMKEQIADKIFKIYKETKKSNKKKELQNRINGINKKIDNLLVQFEDGMHSEAMKERLIDLERIKEQLSHELEKETINQQESLTREDIKETLDNFSSFDFQNEKERKDFVNAFVKKIKIYKNKIIITYSVGEYSSNLYNGGLFLNVNETKLYINKYLNLILEKKI